MKFPNRTLSTLLLSTLLLFITLALSAPVTGSGLGIGDRDPTTTGTVAQSPVISRPMVPASDPPAIDCTKPLPGQVTKVIEDNEILVALTTNAGWDDSGRIQLVKLDDKGDDSGDLVYRWDWRNSSDYRDDVIWPVITTGDIDGDGKDEAISAFKDYSGYLQVVSLKNPEVNDETQLDYHHWRNGDHDRKGQELNHFDIATGDLNGRLGDDKADEIVVAFRDNEYTLQVVALNGTSDGGYNYMSWWWSDDHGRGDVGDVSLDIGDLDGDGYDDEIVLAFADGGQDQQVVVLEYTHDGIREIGWEYWTSYDRGSLDLSYAANVDVTVGDFDGDFTDEIAVAVRDGSKALQVTQIVFVPDGDSLRDRVNASGRWRSTGHLRNAVDFISTASGDIDDDGYEEIIVAFADKDKNLSTVTLDAESGSPKMHGSYRKTSNQLDDVHWVAVDAGDIDGDSKAEVVVALTDSSYDLHALSFDDNPKCPCDDDAASGLLPREDWQNLDDDRGDAGMISIALGDVDGDSVFGDYTGVCDETEEMRLIAMANRPPYWQDLNPGTEVAYGTSIKKSDTDEDHITNSYSSSVTIDDSFNLGGVKLGASFSYGWGDAVSQSWTKGNSVETKSGWKAPNDGIVAVNSVSYYAYQYEKRDGTGLARVSVPVSTQTDAKLMSIWNQSDGAREAFPDSWVPAYRTGWMDDRIISETLGDSSQGAGSDIYDIDGNGKPDYLFAWIDSPAGENKVSYRIAWDVQGDGNPSNGWSDIQTVDLSIGWENSGLGVALTDLDGNSTPELFIAWVANPSGNNWAAYSVGRDLNSSGEVSSWSAKKVIPGWIGSSTNGVGLDIVNLNGNDQPEMFFGWIDDPGGVNHGYYRMGWDMDADGAIVNWWEEPKKIAGAFNTRDSGLGLSVADLDNSGQPELVATWVQDRAEQDVWAYTIGENLNGGALVSSWVPGYGIPSWLKSRTTGVALATANLNRHDDLPEFVISWIDDASGPDKAWLQVGKYWPFGSEVDQRPSAAQDDDPDDGRFKIKLFDTWWNVNGDITWRYDDVKDSNGANLPEIFVSKGGAPPYWVVIRSQYSSYSAKTSSSYNYKVGGKAEFLGIGAGAGETWGFEQGNSYTIGWENGLLLDGQSNGLPWIDESNDKQYKYVPFTYMQEAMSTQGVEQAYMVLDYLVDYPVPILPGSSSMIGIPTPKVITVKAEYDGAAPNVPLIESPSHPNSNIWYAANDAVFNWRQPAGDTSEVDGYRWYLDQKPDTVPSGMSYGLVSSTSYDGLADELWWLHLRARGAGGDWSETAHHAIRVDANPPQVTITPDRPLPLENGGWYNTAVTVAVESDDGNGSGIQSVEISKDGLIWQPYTSPLFFDTDSPLTVLQARATDMVGHISEPQEITFGIDLTAPNSAAGADCWEPGGDCQAEVLINEIGNEQFLLSGVVDDLLSGVKGLSIQINDQSLRVTNEIGDGRWSYTPNKELGAGCHDFSVWAEDLAGNSEPQHLFTSGVVWQPKEKPDLSGSSFNALPAEVRDDEEVEFIMILRNNGLQEAWIPVIVELPSGLEIMPDTDLGGGEYDLESHTINWSPEYLWPGETRHLTFTARVEAGQPAAALAVTARGHATWPISEDCPPEALPPFSELESKLEITATVQVSPNLPTESDNTPPDPPRLIIKSGVATQSQHVLLEIDTHPDTAVPQDVAWMYLREWTWDTNEEAWIVSQESGWLPFTPTYPWTLSAGDGVKYVGVWLADAARNISTMDSRNLTYINLLGPSQFLAEAGRIQYRFPFSYQQLALFNAVSYEGNVDLYVWPPNYGFKPQYAARGAGFVDTVAFLAEQGGLHLVEVQAAGDSTYQLLTAGDAPLRESAAFGAMAETPQHPLTVSDPLSAGAVVAPDPSGFLKTYFPIVVQTQ